MVAVTKPHVNPLTPDKAALCPIWEEQLECLRCHHPVAYLRYTRSQPQSVVCLFVASDGRFLKAADAEGLKTLNPEAIAGANVLGFLASL